VTKRKADRPAVKVGVLGPRKGRDIKPPRYQSSVDSYPYREELRDCLGSGWSVHFTMTYLQERHGKHSMPSLRSLYRWQEKNLTPEARVLPPEIIRNKLKGLTYKVDTMAHLARLVLVCEQRLGESLEAEKKAAIPLPMTDNIIATYDGILQHYIRLAQDLGEMPSRPPAPLIDARSINVDPETLARMAAALEQVKKLQLGMPVAEVVVEALGGRSGQS